MLVFKYFFLLDVNVYITCKSFFLCYFAKYFATSSHFLISLQFNRF